jgi:anti-sigma factor RsiW
MTWKDPLARIARGRRRRAAPAVSAGGELTCQELVELVTDYLEGALSPDDRLRFEAHLDGCGGCRAYLDQMRATILAAGGAADADLDPAMRQRLMDSFRDWRSSRDV